MDEEFVWERNIGDTFTLGTQSWKIRKIDHQNVEVVPVTKSGSMAPFWRGDHLIRNFYLSEKIALFLKEWNRKIEESNALLHLMEEYYLDKNAGEELIDFLKKQKNTQKKNKMITNQFRVYLKRIMMLIGFE